MIRSSLACALGIALTACATTDGPKITLVETDPAGAIVQVDGFGECEAPCRIELDKPRNLTIAKAGYDAERLTLSPGTKILRVKLRLSAPTTGVEEEPLPAL
ncbi:MAG: PEGA domain-containing protein [Parvularculaceae bacterium]|nr:PEGA domain-containing protein [Parvularculaceae bacterium]